MHIDVVTRRLVLTAFLLFGLGGIGMTALHLGPSELNPITKTLSEYALLANGWLFSATLVSAGIGSAVLTVAMVRSRLTPGRLPGWLTAIWSVCLVVIALVPKDGPGEPTLGGHVHRFAVLVGFLSLPIAGLAIARAHAARPEFRRIASAVDFCSKATMCSVGGFLGVYGILRLSGWRWGDLLPLGLLERQVCVTALFLLVLFGLWATRLPQRNGRLQAEL